MLTTAATIANSKQRIIQQIVNVVMWGANLTFENSKDSQTLKEIFAETKVKVLSILPDYFRLNRGNLNMHGSDNQSTREVC